MDAVMDPQLISRAVYQLMLSTSALDIVQEDRTTTRTKVSTIRKKREGERKRERDRDRGRIWNYI
jgi:hypothetical protein